MTTRVLVADDSLFMRKLITNLLQEEKDLVVVGTAKNGEEVVQMVEQLRPHVVTMDVEMPRMNGLDAVKRIMTQNPVPIVMLSSLTEAGARVTLDALYYGAVDFLQKPSGTVSADLHKVRHELIAKVKMAAKVHLGKHIPPQSSPPPVRKNLLPPAVASNAGSKSGSFQIVAIGTSTGGPSALNQLIPYIQTDLPIAVLIVQHMPPLFTKSLADRLDACSPMRVVEAKHNDLIERGTVYIAPGTHHMVVAQGKNDLRIRLNEDALRNGHRPSVDVMFESVAKLRCVTTHYVIMTGMGNDGASGMMLGKRCGAASTIAESAETCVVHGMPKAAVELNCVDYELPLQSIANKLTKLIRDASH